MITLDMDKSGIIRAESESKEYQLKILGIVFTRVGISREDTNLLSVYECVDIAGRQHKLNELYVNQDGITTSLKDILKKNKFI